MNNEINVRTLCRGVYDERANDKGAISRFLSDTSANASGSILYLYERMNARRCKISFLCNTLWAAAKSQNRRKTGQIQQPKLLRSAMMIYALLAVNVKEVRVL